MELLNYTIVAPDSPIHFPNIHLHNPDVLDIALAKTSNIQYDIQNLNKLSSDHNPILLDISSQSSRNRLPTTVRNITNWNRFALHLHETLISPNPIIDSNSTLDLTAKNVTKIFQDNLKRNTICLPNNQLKDFPSELQHKLNKNKKLRPIWQHIRDSEAKTQYNRQTQLIRDTLQSHYNDE